MKKQKYSCGYENSPKWLRRILSYKFDCCCQDHDKDYEKETKLTQSQADVKFRDCMRKKAGKNLFWILIAWIFYLAVKIGGKKAYKK